MPEGVERRKFISSEVIAGKQTNPVSKICVILNVQQHCDTYRRLRLLKPLHVLMVGVLQKSPDSKDVFVQQCVNQYNSDMH